MLHSDSEQVVHKANSITLSMFKIFADTFCRQFATKLLLNVSPHPCKRVAKLPYETRMLQILHPLNQIC